MEESPVFIFRADCLYPEDGGRRFLHNIGYYLASTKSHISQNSNLRDTDTLPHQIITSYRDNNKNLI
jgi:hypothetical protein